MRDFSSVKIRGSVCIFFLCSSANKVQPNLLRFRNLAQDFWGG